MSKPYSELTEEQKEKRRDSVRRYRQTHLEQARVRALKWNREHPEQARFHVREWQKAHPEQCAANARKWAEENPERKRANERSWRQSHPECKRAIKHARRARLAGAGGTYTLTEWQACKKKHGYRCALCGKKKPLTRDHIVPISKGGSNYIENIQPLCLSCNSKKGAK